MKRVLDAFIAVTPILALAAAVYILVIIPIAERRSQLAERKSHLQTEAFELDKRLERFRNRPEKIEFPDELLWKSPSKVDGELALQRGIVKLAEQSGVSLQRFGPVKSKLDTQRDLISLDVEAETDLKALAMFLERLERQSPKVAIQQMRIRRAASQSANSTDTRIFVHMRIWGYFEVKP